MTTRSRAAVLTAAALTLALSACANPEQAPSAPAGAGPAATAANNQASGPTCSHAKTGYPKVELTSAVVGFSQSEKEGNPFRIAETQSIRDEAAKQATNCWSRTHRATSTSRSATSSRCSPRARSC